MSTVSLKNIYKIYDNSVTAVSDFNLEIADKEFIVLVGPSGCGKSTTLRMVAGWRRSARESCTSTASWSTTWSPKTGTSRWCSRATHCIPT